MKAKTLTLEKVSRKLKPFEPGAFFNPPWQDIMTFHKDRGAVGQVRCPEDWSQLPIDKLLRVVLLESEPETILRWGDEDGMSGVLGGFFHDHLIRQGDQRFSSIKSGYMRVRASGKIEVG